MTRPRPTTRPAPRRAGAGCAAARFALHRGGAAAVEFAAILPALILMIFGIIEFGRALWIQNALNYSVEQAARCAAIDANTCGTAAATTVYAAGLAGAGFTPAIFTATSPACGSLVSATLPLPLYIPYFNFAPTLTAQSCFPK